MEFHHAEIDRVKTTEALIKAREELEKVDAACSPPFLANDQDWKNYSKAKHAYDKTESAYYALFTAEQRLYLAIFGKSGNPKDIPAVPSAIWQVVSTLNPREQIVLPLRFGRFGKCNTLEAVGAVLGVTRARVRQIEVEALRKLRHPSRSRIIKAMVQGEDWSVPDLVIKVADLDYWRLRIKQFRTLGMKPYAAHCLMRLAYRMDNKRDYRKPEELTEDDLLFKNCGIGPKTLQEIKRFIPIKDSEQSIDP